jgi:hypothetical protein
MVRAPLLHGFAELGPGLMGSILISPGSVPLSGCLCAKRLHIALQLIQKLVDARVLVGVHRLSLGVGSVEVRALVGVHRLPLGVGVVDERLHHLPQIADMAVEARPLVSVHRLSLGGGVVDERLHRLPQVADIAVEARPLVSMHRLSLGITVVEQRLNLLTQRFRILVKGLARGHGHCFVGCAKFTKLLSRRCSDAPDCRYPVVVSFHILMCETAHFFG